MTNTEFAKTNKAFINACCAVSILPGYEEFAPTTRQASKWRNKKGIAYKVANSEYPKEAT